jgi:hypothetical protein
MDLESAIRQVERQTGTDIVLNKAVHGQVTVHARKEPAELVLRAMARQVGARVGHVYPIYRSQESLKDLKSLVELWDANKADAQRWTNFTIRHSFWGARHPFVPITLQIDGKEARAAALTLSYAARAQVSPEDGIDTKVTLGLTNAPREQAVADLAQALDGRSWSSFYYLVPERLGHGVPKTDQAKQERAQAKFDAKTQAKQQRKQERLSLSIAELRELKDARSADPAFQQHVTDKMVDSIRQGTPEAMVQQGRHDVKKNKGQRAQPTDPKPQ